MVHDTEQHRQVASIQIMSASETYEQRPIEGDGKKPRGRWPRKKNTNMVRTAAQSTWLQFCAKYRSQVLQGDPGIFKTMKLPDKTRHMARAYRVFKDKHGLNDPPAPKSTDPNSARAKYTSTLKNKIEEATFTLDKHGDQHGFVTFS